MPELIKHKRQISFDLNTKHSAFNNNAYKKIKTYLISKNWNHIQGSTYVSNEEFATSEIHKFVKQMFSKLPELKIFVKDIVQTEIGEQTSLMKNVKKVKIFD